MNYLNYFSTLGEEPQPTKEEIQQKTEDEFLKELEAAQRSNTALNSKLQKALDDAENTLCGCEKDRIEAINKKREELNNKYPVMECGPNPTPECMAYNLRMTQMYNLELHGFVNNIDQDISALMSGKEKQSYKALGQILTKIRAKHPEAAKMSLAAVYVSYPEEFMEAYNALIPSFPFLKNLTPEDAFFIFGNHATDTLGEVEKVANTYAAPIPTKTSTSLIEADESAAKKLVIGFGLIVGLLFLFKRKR